METGPPALIEAIVGLLIPPASREHLLGDLRERYVSTRQYLVDAVRVVPLVMLSRMRRTSDWLLTALQAYVLFLVFRPPTFAPGLAGALPLVLPIGTALVALAFEAFERLAISLLALAIESASSWLARYFTNPRAILSVLARLLSP